MRWETSKSQKPQKPVETICTIRDDNNYSDSPSMEELEDYAKKNGYTVHPMEQRHTDLRAGENRGGQTKRSSSHGDKLEIKCWHCGKMGHFSKECRGKDKSFKFAPPRSKRIYSMELDSTDSQTGSLDMWEDLE